VLRRQTFHRGGPPPRVGVFQHGGHVGQTGQLARRYGLPFRSSNVTGSNAVDAQAAYESEMAVWGAVMGGGNLIAHGAGWMEGGLVASLEKFMVDIDLIQTVAEFLTPLEMTEDALDHSRFLDERDQTQATAAAGTGQHVESERPPQRRCHAGFGAGGAHRDVGEPIGSRSLRHLLTTTPRTMPRPIRHGLTGRSRQATVGRMVDVRKTDVFAR